MVFYSRRRKTMKRFLNIKTLALALILLAGNMPIGAQERPFSCNGKGIATMIPGGSVPVADVIVSGNATHLGLFVSTARVTFNPDANDPNIAHPSGQAPFIAADGDRLDFVIEDGTVNLTTGLGTGTFRIVGGSGKFANATGSLSVVVQQNFITGAVDFTAVGKIDY
jgi:hypothetical protein